MVLRRRLARQRAWFCFLEWAIATSESQTGSSQPIHDYETFPNSPQDRMVESGALAQHIPSAALRLPSKSGQRRVTIIPSAYRPQRFAVEFIACPKQSFNH